MIEAKSKMSANVSLADISNETPISLRNGCCDNATAIENDSTIVLLLLQRRRGDLIEDVDELRWGVLWLTVVIVLTAAGNVLVCLAVCWERRLQNMTNYFLMSLAIADLLVSVLVMPFAMVVELYGKLSDCIGVLPD